MPKNKREAARLRARFDSGRSQLGSLFGRLDAAGTLYRFNKHHWKLCVGRAAVLEFWIKNNGQTAWRFGKGEVCRGSREAFAAAFDAHVAAKGETR